jgi:hypothetical protein
MYLWKIAKGNIVNNQIINTKHFNLPSQLECSPVYYEHNNNAYLSYIGGHITAEAIQYHLYLQQNNLDPKIIVYNTRLGCVCPNYYIYLHDNDYDFTIVNTQTQIKSNINLNFYDVLRVVYLPSNYNKLLITGTFSSDMPMSTYLAELSYDYSQVTLLGELLVNSKPVYKSCIVSDSYNTCIHTVQLDAGYEARELHIDNYHMAAF